jgi:hypothetical protein
VIFVLGRTAALLTRMSTPPKSRSTRRTAFFSAATSTMSACTMPARPPFFSISAHTLRAVSSSSRNRMTGTAPASASTDTM